MSYDWLENTYWYVPEGNLLAVMIRPAAQQVIPVQDQTVFHITGARHGYFWGDTVIQLQDQQPTCYFLSGSVTPLGNVLLTFTSRGGSSAPTVTHGSGVMCLFDGQPAMLNQMSSGSAQLQIEHWAYMLQTKEGDAVWDSLPGAGVPVPEFLSACS